MQRAWQWVRPLQTPRYVRGTPRIDDGLPANVVRIPNPQTLAAAAMSQEATCFVEQLIAKLTPSDESAGYQAFLRLCRSQFGAYWRYADLPTVLWAVCTLIRPNTYLEVGVRRGRSAAVVAASRPACAIYGFDLWVPDYAGVANLGPEFVHDELRRVGHTGEIILTSGDSQETVPAFLASRPDLFFDLITIDGDHSARGAAMDLANLLPRLKVGGIVAFDDLNTVHVLRRVWKKLIEHDSRYLTWQFTDAGYGVAAAIRVSDEPLTDLLRRS